MISRQQLAGTVFALHGLMVAAGCSTNGPTQPPYPWAHNDRTIERSITDPDKEHQKYYTIYFTPNGAHMGGREGYTCELVRIARYPDETRLPMTIARGRTSIYEHHRLVGMVLVSARGTDYYGKPFAFDRALAYITTHLPPGSSGNVSGSFGMPDDEVPFVWRSIEWDIPGVRDYASAIPDDITEIKFEMIDEGFTIEHRHDTQWFLTENH